MYHPKKRDALFMYHLNHPKKGDVLFMCHPKKEMSSLCIILNKETSSLCIILSKGDVHLICHPDEGRSPEEGSHTQYNLSLPAICMRFFLTCLGLPEGSPTVSSE